MPHTFEGECQYEIVSAGVDPGHQTDHCDRCGYVFDKNCEEDDDEIITTCTDKEYIALCRSCYSRAGQSVR